MSLPLELASKLSISLVPPHPSPQGLPSLWGLQAIPDLMESPCPPLSLSYGPVRVAPGLGTMSCNASSLPRRERVHLGLLRFSVRGCRTCPVMGGTHSPTRCQRGQDPGSAIYCCPIHPIIRGGPQQRSPRAGGRCLSYPWAPPLLPHPYTGVSGVWVPRAHGTECLLWGSHCSQRFAHISHLSPQYPHEAETYYLWVTVLFHRWGCFPH